MTTPFIHGSFVWSHWSIFSKVSIRTY